MKLHLKVKPNSKTDEITREPDGSLKVKIKAPPVDGKANKYLVEYLSRVFGIPKSAVELLKGETSQFKTVEIDAPEEAITKRLSEL